MTQPPAARSPRLTPRSIAALPHPELWLIDAVRRAGNPIADGVKLEPSDSAWRVLTGLGFGVDTIAEVAASASARRQADFVNESSRLAFYMPVAVADRYNVVPVSYRDERLGVATSNPLRMHLEEDLAFACGVKVELFVAPPAAIVAARSRVYVGSGTALDRGNKDGRSNEGFSQLTTLGRFGGEAATGSPGASGASRELLEEILSEAIQECASDVHLEPIDGGGMVVRLRVDGSLYESRRVPEETRAVLIRRLKVACKIDIADSRRPQSGRATFTFAGRSIELRVSTLPLGSNVEKVSIRVLDSSATSLDLNELGFSRAELVMVDRLMHLAEGLVLVTGPTGSGKTSTVYSMLNALRASEYNIMTVEDPVEYRLDGITQIQVEPKAGMTFAAGLRTLLRQDPDVVLVGEIRDVETADITVKAGMTGHLVFSSLHTGDAASTIHRLLAMNIDSASLSATLKGVVSQRLVRRLCTACSVSMDLETLPHHHQMLLAGRDTSKLRGPMGCAACRGTGYKGRILIAEVFFAVPEIQNAIARRASEAELAQIAADSGMLTMWQSGLSRVLDGTTSLFEMVDNVAPPMAAVPTAGQAEVDALVAEILGTPRAACSIPIAAPLSGPAEFDIPRVRDVTPIKATPIAAPIAAKVASVTPIAATRVLLVDDDAAARRELATLLTREGFSVIEAADGESAVKYARRLRPAFVLTELALPKLDGLTLLEALLPERDSTRVVIYSRQADPDLLKWAVELGAFDAMSRDVDPRVLCARLRQALASAA